MEPSSALAADTMPIYLVFVEARNPNFLVWQIDGARGIVWSRNIWDLEGGSHKVLVALESLESLRVSEQHSNHPAKKFGSRRGDALDKID